MGEEKVKRNYKDSVFRSLFNNEKELLSLYNALTGKNYPEDTEIEIVTLDNAVYNDLKNDLAFVINKKFINLTEHQSTISPNMPLRFLEYISKEYQKMHFSRDIYSEKTVDIPTPEFYVLYNGVKEMPLKQTLKLSDTFAGECDTISLELIVKVINVNLEKGSDILDKCRTLKEYSVFMHRIRMFREIYGDLEKAIDISIRDCINDGILAEFLKENRGEVMSFIEMQLTVEEREEIREQDGYYKGQMEKAREIAKNLKDAGLDIELISENTGLSIEEVKEL